MGKQYSYPLLFVVHQYLIFVRTCMCVILPLLHTYHLWRASTAISLPEQHASFYYRRTSNQIRGQEDLFAPSNSWLCKYTENQGCQWTSSSNLIIGPSYSWIVYGRILTALSFESYCSVVIYDATLSSSIHIMISLWNLMITLSASTSKKRGFCLNFFLQWKLQTLRRSRCQKGRKKLPPLPWNFKV